ncbi:MAG TPA: AAA family ATPase [Candidatus Elarobacter sp.]|nr:AAA family ATPase [Candidatus Elarobacter sp.]
MTARANVCPQLIAREDELRTLAALRRAAAQGHGSLALIEGEAGIGKTRLVAAFRENVAGRAAVGIARCREFGNVPYGPVHDSLRHAGARLPAAAGRDRTEHLAGLVGSLLDVARGRLVVVILEDVQWADDGTLGFLAYAVPALASARALVIATYRTDEVLSESHAAPYLARVARDTACRRITVGALTAAQTRRLVTLSATGDAALRRADVDTIVERSEGNPFVAEELLTEMLARRGDEESARTLPLTIRAVVDERMRRLDEPARRLVVLASVIGRRFAAPLLADVANLPLDEVLAALRRARDARFVDEMTGDGRFAFRHALTREAIYEGLLAAETRRLHGDILAALERSSEPRVEELGYHAWAARDGDACLRYNEAAGDAALAVHAHAEALRCFERALLGARGDAKAATLLAKAATTCARDGDSKRAAQLYESAAVASARSGAFGAAAEHYELMAREARISGDTRTAIEILERALPMAPEDDPRLRSRIAVTLTFLHVDRGDVAAARESLALCGPEDSMGCANASAYYGIACGRIEPARRALEKSLAAADTLGADRVLTARFNAAFAHAVLGFDLDALAQLDALMPELEERRLHALQVLLAANAALVLVRLGRVDEARAHIERALAMPEPSTTGPIALASAALSLAGATGDDTLARRTVTPPIVEAAFASGINTTLGRFAGPYARRLSARGDDEAALEVLHRAMDAIASPLAATETLLAAAALGDPPTRRRALGQLPAIDAMAHLPLYAATAAHLRALDARHRGDPAAAPIARDAVRHYRELGWPLHASVCAGLAGDREPIAARDRERPRDARRDGSRALPLSAREREIAVLIARGTSNVALAERFAVNRRTIEKHLTSIYGKLGVRNRSQLAAFVVRSER